MPAKDIDKEPVHRTLSKKGKLLGSLSSEFMKNKRSESVFEIERPKNMQKKRRKRGVAQETRCGAEERHQRQDSRTQCTRLSVGGAHNERV